MPPHTYDIPMASIAVRPLRIAGDRDRPVLRYAGAVEDPLHGRSLIRIGLIVGCIGFGLALMVIPVWWERNGWFGFTPDLDKLYLGICDEIVPRLQLYLGMIGILAAVSGRVLRRRWSRAFGVALLLNFISMTSVQVGERLKPRPLVRWTSISSTF